MKRHDTLSKERQALKSARETSPVTVHKGRYSWESTLIQRNGDLERITERMADCLENIARGYGFGEEYIKICAMLADLNTHYRKSARCVTEGIDWEDAETVRKVTRQKQETYNGLIFGRTQAEIAEMQGSAPLR